MVFPQVRCGGLATADGEAICRYAGIDSTSENMKKLPCFSIGFDSFIYLNSLFACSKPPYQNGWGVGHGDVTWWKHHNFWWISMFFFQKTWRLECCLEIPEVDVKHGKFASAFGIVICWMPRLRKHPNLAGQKAAPRRLRLSFNARLFLRGTARRHTKRPMRPVVVFVDLFIWLLILNLGIV